MPTPETTADICAKCDTRVYVGNQLACQLIGQARHLCGESPLLPSPRLLKLTILDRSKSCPHPDGDKWGDAPRCVPGQTYPTTEDRAAQRAAYKHRRKNHVVSRH